MKSYCLALVAGLLACAPTIFSLPQAVDSVPQFSADVVLVRQNHSGVRGRVFFGGQKWRFDVASGDRVGEMILDFSTQTAYVLLPQQKLYVELHGNAAGAAPFSLSDLRPPDPSNPCALTQLTQCMRIGSATVDGRPCDNWQLDRVGTTRVGCLDKRLRFFIRTSDSNGRTVELRNIREGRQPRELFQIPADYRELVKGSR